MRPALFRSKCSGFLHLVFTGSFERGIKHKGAGRHKFLSTLVTFPIGLDSPMLDDTRFPGTIDER
jgi:hypothetical protein